LIVTLRTTLIALAALLASAQAHAQLASQPQPGPGDPRIKEFLYDPDEVVAIHGQLGYELTIEFDPNERIENVSVGDSLSWQVTPNRKATLLFLKPMAKAKPTSMTVVTTGRIYSFLLTAFEGKGPTDPNQMMRLRFLYPQPPPPPPEPVKPAAAAPRPEDFNFDYSISGQKQLGPIRVFDDGRSTYFQFDPKKDSPAVFVLGVDGKEEMAETRISGPYTIADRTSEMFVLRYGKSTAKLRNNAWSRQPPTAPAPLPIPGGG
jgi:type IV secretion system protein VirB9